MDLTPKLLGACLFGSACVAYLVAEHTPLFLVTCILVFLASVLGEVAVIDEAGALVHDTPFALPLLDFSPFMRDEGVVVDEAPTAAQRETARELDQVARAHGFVALTRFGVDRALLQRAWNESAQLFALPPERKRALAQISAETNRGYSGLGRESLNRNRAGEPKEAFNVRRAGNNYTGVPDGFATVAATLWARLERAAPPAGVRWQRRPGAWRRSRGRRRRGARQPCAGPPPLGVGVGFVWSVHAQHCVKCIE